MKRSVSAVLLLFSIFSYEGSASAVDLGFESGNTSGWTESFAGMGPPGIDIVKSWSNPHGSENYQPKDGNYFAVLSTGGEGQYAHDQWASLSQKFKLRAGDKLEGWSAFCCGDEVYYPEGIDLSFNDWARASVTGKNGLVSDVAWYADALEIGYNVTGPDGSWDGYTTVNFGPVPWQHWSWMAPASGEYTLEFITRQSGDMVGPSYGFIDGVKRVQASEPSSAALLGSVFLAFAFFAARKKAAVAL